MQKILVVERPGEDDTRVPFDDGSIKRFHLDEADVDWLNRGETLFRGDNAFSIEEE